MFLDKEVLTPVMKSIVPRNSRRKPMRLTCRYDVKYDGDVVFEKDKARIVATELKKDSNLTCILSSLRSGTQPKQYQGNQSCCFQL